MKFALGLIEEYQMLEKLPFLAAESQPRQKGRQGFSAEIALAVDDELQVIGAPQSGLLREIPVTEGGQHGFLPRIEVLQVHAVIRVTVEVGFRACWAGFLSKNEKVKCLA